MERPSFNPYGAPVPTTDQEWVRSLISGDYRPLFGFAAAVTVSLGLKVLVEAAAAIISVASIGMVNRALAGQLAPLATVEAIVAGGRVVARVDLIATVGAIVAFCAFVVRAHGNAVSFGRMPLEFTAAGAVAYFFVPLAGLFQPFRAMAEIWRASEPRPGQAPLHLASLSGLLAVWWAAFVVHVMAGLLSHHFSVPLHDSRAYVTYAHVRVVSAIATIIAALFAIAVARSLARRQDACQAAMNPMRSEWR